MSDLASSTAGEAALPGRLAAFRSIVDDALEEVTAGLVTRLTRMHPGLAALAEELRGFVAAGGKRLRPVLVMLGHDVAGGADPADVVGPALAVELLHTCALVHDDIIDAAFTRRGRRSVHVHFARRHAAAGWEGDAARYGEAAALILGDLAFVESDRLFLTARQVAPDDLLTAFDAFTAMREELTAGQYLDVTAARSRETSPDLAMAVATYKSGCYSVARPLEIGALLAGRRDLAAALARAGQPLGQAFQLRDDILGLFGTEQELGKSTVSDLVEGKRTLLVALTTERLAADDRARFEQLIGRPDLSAVEAEELRAMMRGSGALAATEERVDALVGAAMRAFDALPLAPAARDALREVAAYLVRRRA